MKKTIRREDSGNIEEIKNKLYDTKKYSHVKEIIQMAQANRKRKIDDPYVVTSKDGAKTKLKKQLTRQVNL